jgi:hypothetical protein
MLSQHLSLCQVGVANLLAGPHCCMANYTLPNHDLYMISATISTRYIVRLFKLPKIKKVTGCSMPKIHYLAAQTFASKTKPPIFRLLYDGLKHGELWKSHKM